MPDALIRLEAWASLWPEIEPLLREHHAESRESLPFAPNHKVLAIMEEAGMMKITTARSAGELVGYITWYLGPHLQSRGIVTATQGPWFVTGAVRQSSLGLRLFRHSLAHLRSLGVHLAFPHWQEQGASAGLRHFFERLGAKPYETTWQLEL